MPSGFQRVPDRIRDEVGACSSDTFFVVATRTVSRQDIESGTYEHLSVRASGDDIDFDEAVLPESKKGRWSRYNLVGRVIVRRDLPKIRKEMGGWYAPNFGDHSKGEHYVSIEREVFQKQTLHAKQYPLLVTVQTLVDGRVRITAQVDRLYSAREVDEPDFLLGLSLLRENLGEPHVVSSDLTVDEWLADRLVSWELLPVGTGQSKVSLDAVVQRLGSNPPPDRLQVLTERFEAMSNTGYSAVIVGREGFRRYVGYQYKENLVVLENFDYGNALYVLYDDWENSSGRSRLELLADPDARFDRVPHRSGWQERVAYYLKLHGHNVP